ncbi:MAG: enoyl-CoA hydratase/isomerase family protein [Candidatus Thorarchaeota archaeon]
MFVAKDTSEFEFKEIIYEKKDRIATVTINRPHVYNAYSTLTLQEMNKAFHDASWDDSIAVVVLTGAGEKAFCTGGDVKEYANNFVTTPHNYWKWMGVFQEAHDIFRNIGKPTIARINGIVAGGGNEWNLACDLAIAADHATIRQVGTRVGSVACGGATQWLPIVVGDRRAREILFTCEPIPAKKALEWGLVNEVVPYSEIDTAVQRLSVKLIDKFPECARYTKQQLNFWKDLSWHQTIGHAKDWLAVHYTSWEPYEGMTSFVEKRPPEYQKIRDSPHPEFLWGPPTKECKKCKSKGIPSDFEFCGKCGTKI